MSGGQSFGTRAREAPNFLPPLFRLLQCPRQKASGASSLFSQICFHRSAPLFLGNISHRNKIREKPRSVRRTQSNNSYFQGAYKDSNFYLLPQLFKLVQNYLYSRTAGL